MKTWTSEGIESLNGCFEITDWDVFLSDCCMDSAAEVISYYINFCLDMIINTEQIRSFGKKPPKKQAMGLQAAEDPPAQEKRCPQAK